MKYRHAILPTLLLIGICVSLVLSPVCSEASTAQTYFLQGNSFLNKNKLEKAIENYEKAIALNPKVARYYYSLARAYHRKKSYDEAITQYEKVLDIDSKFYWSYSSIGDIYLEKGDFSKAVSYFEIYIYKTPNESEKHYYRGRILDIQGKTDDAIKEYEEALKNRSDHFDALKSIALNYMKKNDHPQAESYLSRAKKLRRYDEETLINLGIVYTKMKENAKALDVLNVALRINPFNRDTRFYLGKAYYGSGDLERAIQQMKQALTVAPDDSEIHFTLGLYYDKKGWHDLAAAEYKEALYLNPDYLLDKLEEIRQGATMDDQPETNTECSGIDENTTR